MEEDSVEDKVVTLMREARVEQLILMLMLQLLMWEEELHRLTEGEAVERVEEDDAFDHMEIVLPVKGMGEEDVVEEED